MLSEVAAFVFMSLTVAWNGFPRSTYLIDVLLCSLLIGASRFWERAVAHALRSLVGRGTQRRVLIVGAGQSGRSLLRELRETPGERVIGFVDDDRAVRGRRIQGVPVVGTLEQDRLAARAVRAGRGPRDDSRRAPRTARRRHRGVRPRRRRVPVRPPSDRSRSVRRPGHNGGVSAIATPRRAEETRSRPSRTIADRLLAAVPLASIYLWLCIVYVFEAWRRVTPWLFTDELETTQIARAIAATGHPARRGVPYHHHSFYPLMLAPVWLIDNVATAYSGVKYLDVFVMTSVIFPTYFLARLVVRRGWALFAAIGAAAIPSLAYSSWIVEETVAYPYAALCFFLVAKALIERSRGWIAGAIIASLFAPFVRGELVMIPIAFVFAAFFAAWSSDWGQRRRSTWSVGDYIGVFVLAAGLIITISGVASHHSQQWYSVTTYYKHRIFVLGDWAAGALAIGLGVIPLVFAWPPLVPANERARRERCRLFRCVSAAGIIGFGLYTAMKAAYLSTVFETRVEERNLIYIAPLLFIGTALVLERRRANLVALAAAAAYGFYLVVGTPFHKMGVQLYSDALGFSILQQANRYYEWTPVAHSGS